MTTARMTAIYPGPKFGFLTKRNWEAARPLDTLHKGFDRLTIGTEGDGPSGVLGLVLVGCQMGKPGKSSKNDEPSRDIHAC